MRSWVTCGPSLSYMDMCNVQHGHLRLRMSHSFLTTFGRANPSPHRRVLSCKHVSDVVIDPPWHLTREMIAALNISVVAHGSVYDPNDDGGADPYEVPKSMGYPIPPPPHG